MRRTTEEVVVVYGGGVCHMEHGGGPRRRWEGEQVGGVGESHGRTPDEIGGDNTTNMETNFFATFCGIAIFWRSA